MQILKFAPACCAGVALAVLALASSRANATVVDDTSLVSPPGVYYGSGNSGLNQGWTVSTQNGVELGLGVNNRGIGGVNPTPNTNVYNVNTGYSTFITGACPANTCAIWNFEYSVNLLSSGLTLSDTTPTLTILNVGNHESVSFNPGTTILDNAGWTGSSVNQEPDVGNAFGNDIGAQNSENLTFGFISALNPSFDFNPLANDTYIITVSLLGPDNEDLGSVSEEIIAGTGATPLPAALPLFAGGLGMVGFFARKRKRKTALA